MKTYWKLPLLAALLTVTTAYAQKPRFVVKEGGTICNDFARMLQDSGYTPENTCHWRFRPQGPNAQSPKWTPVDIRQHMDWFADIAMADVARREHLTGAQVDALWKKEFTPKEVEEFNRMHASDWRKYNVSWTPERKARAIEDLKSGRFRYEMAEFDMNEDGKTERVLARSWTACPSTNGIVSPGGPQLYVVGVDGRIDHRYYDTTGLNPFFYQGKTYYAYRDIGHDFSMSFPKHRLRQMREIEKKQPWWGYIDIKSGGMIKDATETSFVASRDCQIFFVRSK